MSTATALTPSTSTAAPLLASMADRTPTEATYTELQQAYDHFNDRLFGGTLPACLITLQREKNVCGYFSSRRFVALDGRFTDEIAMNPAFFAVQPISTTLRTLVHEMVHLWQFHFGKPGRARYHNAEWADKMESIGVMPSDTGRPAGKRTGDRMNDYTTSDGAFERACEELLTASYNLSWYDRFPTNYAEGLGATAGDKVPVADSQPLASALMLNGGRAAAADNDGDGGAGASAAPAQQNRSNRSKYTCGCDNNVWGKPGLQIICAACKAAFVEL